MENITIKNGKQFIKELTRVSWAADSRKRSPWPRLKYVQIKGVDAGELIAGNTELDGEGVNKHWTINAKNLLKVIKGTSRRANVTIKAAQPLRPGLIEIDGKTAGIVCPMRRY